MLLGGDLVDYRKPVPPQLRIQRHRQQAQSVVELVRIGGRGPERQRDESVLMAVGELYRAGGLARTCHPVKHHRGTPGGRGQRNTGSSHHLGTADKPRGWAGNPAIVSARPTNRAGWAGNRSSASTVGLRAGFPT